MKMLLKLVLVLVLLVVVGVVIGAFYIDSMAKSAVEKGATGAMGVNTTLSSADVKVLSGQFALAGLNVANPEGFQTSHFMTLDDGDVSVSLGTLLKDTIELPTLTLDGIDINLEKAGGKSNYNVILDHMKTSEDSAPTPDEKAGKQYVIRHIKITNVMVHTDLVGIGGDLGKMEVPIDIIELHDVGSDGSGLTLRDLSGVIMKTIFAAIVANGSKFPGELVNELGGQLAQLGDLSKFGVEIAGQALGNIGGAAGDLLKGAGDATGGALEGAGDIGEKIDEGVGGLLEGAGGLLGGNKDEPEEEDAPE
jgi:hypothetical protein